METGNEPCPVSFGAGRGRKMNTIKIYLIKHSKLTMPLALALVCY